MPAAYAMWALNVSDRVFLIRYRTLQEIGVYSLAYSLGYLSINLFFNPIWMMYPPAATKFWEELQKVKGKAKVEDYLPWVTKPSIAQDWNEETCGKLLYPGDWII